MLDSAGMKDVWCTRPNPPPLFAVLVVSAATTVFLVALWTWADIGPESSWPRSPWRLGLVALASNVGAATVIFRTGDKARAFIAMLVPVVAASGFVAWGQRADMIYDRSRLSAGVESAGFLVVTLGLAGAGFVLLVLAETLIRRAGNRAGIR